jgi:hypothetical protein
VASFVAVSDLVSPDTLGVAERQHHRFDAEITRIT